MNRTIMLLLFLLFCSSMMPDAALAQDGGTDAETAYILNTFLFLFCGALVMFMSCGFAMLESGMVRYKNVGAIVLKNMALYAIAGLMYYLMGYNLMYSGVDGGYIGQLAVWFADDSAALAGDFTSTPYAAASDWFFQMAFVATTASILSGAVAERMKVWTFLAFVTILTGVLYPVIGAWKWGEGWLHVMGFQDFAGSTIVHSVGGWAALVAAALIGPRAGRYDAEGKPVAILPSNIVAVCLGTFILWLGWFGFNGGSQLALGSGNDAMAIATIFVNTNVAAAAGVVTVMIITQLLRKKIDVYLSLNGALAGLVSITAEPLMPTIGQAAFIGAVGGVILIAAVPLMEKLRLDDVVSAIPVHLCCGIWGTLIVSWSNPDAVFITQFIGVAAIGGFTVISSLVLWYGLRKTLGLRVHVDKESSGLDIAELGIQGLPYLTSNVAMEPRERIL